MKNQHMYDTHPLSRFSTIENIFNLKSFNLNENNAGFYYYVLVQYIYTWVV